MEAMIAVVLILVLFLFVGAVMAFTNNSKISDLQRKVDSLDREVNHQSSLIYTLQRFKTEVEKVLHSAGQETAEQNTAEQNGPEQNGPEQNRPDPSQAQQSPDDKLIAEAPLASQEDLTPEEHSQSAMSKTTAVKLDKLLDEVNVQTVAPHKDRPVNRAASPEPRLVEQKTQITATTFDLDTFLKGNGLLWLGGIILALGGIFLARYSIESGLISPVLRVILGSSFGLIQVVAAEYLNQHAQKFKINTPYISAALASGGFITCFAMTMVAFEFYQFLTPQVAFIILAAISVACTYMSLRFGPLLAVVGLVGAYVVPALVSSGSNNFLALFIYISLVSGSAIWVAETVRQNWLWWLSFVGHFFWVALTALSTTNINFIPLLLFCVVSVYLYSMVSVLGWKLQDTQSSGFSIKLLFMPRKEQLGVLLSVFLMGCYLVLGPDNSNIVWANVVLAGVLGFAAFRHSAFDTWPFVMLVFACGSYLLMPDVTNYEDNVFLFQSGYLFIQLAVLVAVSFSLFMLLRFKERYSYIILLVLTPVCFYGLSYVLSVPEAEAGMYPLWAIELLLLAMLAAVLSIKVQDTLQKVGYLVLLNGCVTLCLTMLLHASVLTMAIVVQVASMSYLSRKYKASIPDWLFKVAISVVVFRLTIAPWMDYYNEELILGLHWTLVIYPAVLGIIWFCRRFNPSEGLQPWFLGIFIHVIALFITTETSYFLLGRYPDIINMQFKEAVLLAMNWLIMAVIYLWRSGYPSRLSTIYKRAGYLLLALTVIMHFFISYLNNPYSTNQFVGDFVLNWLIPLWAVPAALLVLLARMNLLKDSLTQPLYAIASIFGFFYINGVVRSLFNDGVLNMADPIQQLELYTYSIVWLVLSIAAIVASQRYSLMFFRKLGFVILAFVVLKAFLIDMANLGGLYRALSFIGLGLSLVGIGWLFQKLQVIEETTASTDT